MRWGRGEPPRPFWRRAYATDQKQRQELQRERDKNLLAGSWVACGVQDGEELVRLGHCISPAFCIPKKDDPDPRACIDMRIVNESAKKQSARPEGLDLVPSLAQKGWYAMSRDVKKAFHHVGIDQADWPYMTVDLGEPIGPISADNPRFVYVVVLPFGYTNSPAVWQKTMMCIIKRCREQGVPCTLWLDDVLILGATAEACRAHDKIFQEECEAHGIKLHPDKGQHEPKQTILHLGLLIDLKRGLFLVPPAKAARLMKEAKGMLCSACSAKNRRFVRARWLAQLAGLCISLYLAVPSARFRTRSFYDVLKAHDVYSRGYHHMVKLSEAALTDLRWWATLADNNVSRAIWRPPCTATMWVDASKIPGAGSGAILSGPRPEDGTTPARSIWTKQELLRSINFLELRAIKVHLLQFERRLAHSVLLIWEDNQAVMFIMNNLVSRSPEMMCELRAVQDILERSDILCYCRYVRSEANPADYWSRYIDKADWQLRPALAKSLMNRWGRCTIDLFAARSNHQLPRFCSMIPEVGAEAADCFTLDWSGERAWINPPWSKIGRILATLRDTPSAEATLLLPWWPSRPWWPLLLSLTDSQIELSLEDTDILPGPGCVTVPEPLKNPFWTLGLFHVPSRER